jgi:hypothetical protein
MAPDRLSVRKLTPLKIGILALCVGSFALSTLQIYRFTRFGEMRYIAAQVERQSPVSRDRLDRAIADARLVVEDKLCQSEFIRAALTLSLIDLDRQNADRDYEAWAKALEQADRTASFALSCSPTNGNFWVRLAMIRQTITEQPDEVARLVTLSQLYAPAEQNVIAARYRLYNRVSEQTLEKAAAPVAADLELICAPAGAALRKDLPVPRQSLAPYLDAASPGCTIGKSPALKTGGRLGG